MVSARSPTVEIIGLFAVVYLLQAFGSVLGLPSTWYALAAPFARPWTLVTGVYAHGGVAHLVVNSVALVIVGLPLERYASWLRFHGFFVISGAIAGLLQVLVGGLLGGTGAVIGASGAILALYGYVIVGNPVTGGLLSWISMSRRSTLVVFGLAAATVVVLTAGPGVALIAHGAGFFLGLIGGRVGLLGPSSG